MLEGAEISVPQCGLCPNVGTAVEALVLFDPKSKRFNTISSMGCQTVTASARAAVVIVSHSWVCCCLGSGMMRKAMQKRSANKSSFQSVTEWLAWRLPPFWLLCVEQGLAEEREWVTSHTGKVSPPQWESEEEA